MSVITICISYSTNGPSCCISSYIYFYRTYFKKLGFQEVGDFDFLLLLQIQVGLMNIDTSGIASQELHKNLVSHGTEVIKTFLFFLFIFWWKIIFTCSNLNISFCLSQLAIANPRWHVINKLQLANFLSNIGERVFLTVGEAVKASFITKTATV